MIPWRLLCGGFFAANVPESDGAVLAMVLESDDSSRAAHFGILIDERGKMDAIDFLDEPITLGDDLHRVPLVFLVLRLYLGGVSQLLIRSRAVFFDDGLFSRSAHAESSLSLRVRLVEKRVSA